MAAISMRALSAGTVGAAGNLVAHFQPVAAPSRSPSTGTEFSPVCLLGLAPESRRRFIRYVCKVFSNEK